MSDYNHKLSRLEKKYFLKTKKGFLATGKFVEQAIHELYDFYQKRGYQIRCVVGMRQATAMFYEMVPEFPVALTPYEKENLINWEAYTDTDVVLIIGSFNSSRRVERRFWNMNLKCMILNLYDYFYFRGYEINTDFWEYHFHHGCNKYEIAKRIDAFLRHYYFQYGIWHKVLNIFSISDKLANNAIWSRTYCMRKAYESNQGNTDMHEMYLSRFIYECIKGRDYLTAKKYIQEYVGNCYERAGNYQDFLNEWECLLGEIREKIKRRTQDDVVINWLDAISRCRMQNMPYINQLAKNNVQLNRAYTTTPWTTWCMKAIFTGTEAIEGRLFRFKKITSKNCSLMQMIKKHRYRFYYLGSRIIQKKLFLDRDCATTEIKESEMPFTYYYWKMLCLLASSRKKLFLIVHELYATHPPYFSPELNQYEEGNGELAGEEQKNVSCQYVDEQMKWWDGFLNKNICSIYMGDHGDHWQRLDYDYLGSRTNVMFIIKNAKNKLTKVNGFFSLKDMGKLIEYILQWNNGREESVYSDAVRIEGVDRYDRGIVDELLKEKREKYSDYRNWMQFRALRTETDLLVRYANGQDWYFLLPDEETNYIYDTKYQKRIQELKDRLGEEFINIWNEEFFIQSRRLYRELEKTYGQEY